MRHPAAPRLAALATAAAVLSLAAPARAGAWGWNATKGDGRKVTQAREVGPFTRVRLVGSLDARVRVGGPRAVSVTIDENLQPLVEVGVEGDTLVVRSREISFQGEGRVEIAVPSLQAFAVEGSGDAEIAPAGSASVERATGDLALSISGSGDVTWRGEAARLTASISGSGDMSLSGTAASVEISVAGSGDVSARDLAAGSADVSVAGSGDVSVRLTGGALRAAVAGSGDVTWYGEGRVERAARAGSGEINHR